MADWILKWWPLIAMAITGLIAVVGWSSRKQFVTHDQFTEFLKVHAEEHKADAKAHADEHKADAIAHGAVHSELEHTNRKDLEKVLASVSDLKASIQGVASKVDGAVSTIDGLRESFQSLLDHELAEARQAKAAAQKGS